MDGGFEIPKPRDFLLAPGRPIHAIIMEVAEKHGLTYSEMVSARRQKHLVLARHEAYWRCKRECTASYPQIGRAFGDRDHGTIMHGVKQHEKRIADAQKNSALG